MSSWRSCSASRPTSAPPRPRTAVFTHHSHNRPVYGLVFLFKWLPNTEKRAVADAPHVYFARQVITNACATQALLNILLNVPALSLGADLSAFKETTADFSPEVRVQPASAA